MEQSFRHHVARRLFIPSGGFRLVPRAPGFHRDGLEAITQRAWSDWMPPRAVRLDLVVDASGEPRLDVFDSRVRDSLPRRSQRERRNLLAGCGPRPSGHRRNHSANRRANAQGLVVLSEGAPETGEVALGYLATEALPGRTSLRRCLRDVSGEVDIDGLIDCSELVGTGKDAFVECGPDRRSQTPAANRVHGPHQPGVGLCSRLLYEAEGTGTAVA